MPQRDKGTGYPTHIPAQVDDEADISCDYLGAQGDEVYQALIEAHEGLSEAESHALNIRLILILANQIGDAGRLRQIIDAAMDTAP